MPLPKFEHHDAPPRTHVDRDRQVPDDREFPPGTFSQAELTAELVIPAVSPGQPGRELVERLAGGKDDPAHASGTVARHQLNKRPAGVVADEGDVIQVEVVHELLASQAIPGSDRSASARIA